MALFQKMFIGYNFLSIKDTKKLQMPLYFSCQDMSKYVSGDLKNSILKFDPRSWLLSLPHYVQILQPYQKYVKSKF